MCNQKANQEFVVALFVVVARNDALMLDMAPRSEPSFDLCRPLFWLASLA